MLEPDGSTQLEKIDAKLKEKKIERAEKFVYRLYFRLFFSIEHFVGLGSTKGSSDKKQKNLGDLCMQYGNSDQYSEL